MIGEAERTSSTDCRLQVLCSSDGSSQLPKMCRLCRHPKTPHPRLDMSATPAAHLVSLYFDVVADVVLFFEMNNKRSVAAHLVGSQGAPFASKSSRPLP